VFPPQWEHSTTLLSIIIFHNAMIINWIIKADRNLTLRDKCNLIIIPMKRRIYI